MGEGLIGADISGFGPGGLRPAFFAFLDSRRVYSGWKWVEITVSLAKLAESVIFLDIWKVQSSIRGF